MMIIVLVTILHTVIIFLHWANGLVWILLLMKKNKIDFAFVWINLIII